MKRLTDADKWRDPWFSALPMHLKLVAIYIHDKCDASGVYEINGRYCEFECGLLEHNPPLSLDWDEVFAKFNENPRTKKPETQPRVISLGDGRRWWLVKFLLFHYSSRDGTLRLDGAVPVQRNVINQIRANGIEKLVLQFYPGCIIDPTDETGRTLPKLEDIRKLPSAAVTAPEALQLFYTHWDNRKWMHKNKRLNLSPEGLEELLQRWNRYGDEAKAERAQRAAKIAELEGQIAQKEARMNELRADTFTPPGCPTPIIKPAASAEIKQLFGEVRLLKEELAQLKKPA